jgi:hypothetical protein
VRFLKTLLQLFYFALNVSYWKLKFRIFSPCNIPLLLPFFIFGHQFFSLRSPILNFTAEIICLLVDFLVSHNRLLHCGSSLTFTCWEFKSFHSGYRWYWSVLCLVGSTWRYCQVLKSPVSRTTMADTKRLDSRKGTTKFFLLVKNIHFLHWCVVDTTITMLVSSSKFVWWIAISLVKGRE